MPVGMHSCEIVALILSYLANSGHCIILPYKICWDRLKAQVLALHTVAVQYVYTILLSNPCKLNLPSTKIHCTGIN